MTDTNKHKRDFCENELLAVLRCIDENIDSSQYEVTDDGEEYVQLYFSNGYHAAVCVTADSILAIVKDVLSAFE